MFAERLDGEVFWDIAPVGSLGDDKVLDVLEDTLTLDSTACDWAALHGLGHAYYAAPDAAQDIVDGWLRRRRGLSQALRDYAGQARVGAVN
jgi:hypothetical protein